MNLVLVGAGNVGTVLGRIAQQRGHRIMQVFSASEQSAATLANLFAAPYTNKYHEIHPSADAYLVCLTDLAITELHHHWRGGQGLVLHTAAAVPLQALESLSPQIGVLYPLQSLRKERLPVADIPFLISANCGAAWKQLQDLAESLSSQVQAASDEQRIEYHIGAVFASNFTNLMYQLAYEHCQLTGLDFALLLPLIQETAVRLDKMAPIRFQTGPACRGDRATMQMHLEKLGSSSLRELYRTISTTITSKCSKA